eukprot:evm.model.NODE_3634_length_32890_cov_30.974672.4
MLEKAGGKDQPKSKRPRGFRLSYIVPPPPPEAAKVPSKPTAPDQRTEETKLAEKARLKFLDGEKTRKEKLGEIVSAAEAVVALVDTQELALHFGVKMDENNAKAVKVRVEMEEKKTALADALARKARALIDMRKGAGKVEGGVVAKSDNVAEVEAQNKEKKEGQEDVRVMPSTKAQEEEGEKGKEEDEVTAVVAELMKWDALDQDKYARLVLERDMRQGRWGLVLKLLNKLLGDGGNQSGIEKKELYERRTEVFAKLGWTHLLENERKWRVIDCPSNYYLF